LFLQGSTGSSGTHSPIHYSPPGKAHADILMTPPNEWDLGGAPSGPGSGGPGTPGERATASSEDLLVHQQLRQESSSPGPSLESQTMEFLGPVYS